MTSLASRFATALEAQADNPKLQQARLWVALQESVLGRELDSIEINLYISRQWPGLKKYRQRWIEENINV